MATNLWSRFEKMEDLPVGGMGELTKARDKETDEIVLIKTPRKGVGKKEELISRFRRECELMQKIDHPGFVRMLESLDASSGPALVLEFVDGKTLRDILNEKKMAGTAFSFEEFLSIATQVVEAVAYLHTYANIVHRDLKPENIIISETGQVKICDFGIALALNDTRITEMEIKVGTRPYMAPERYSRSEEDASPGVDVYSLGVLFFEMLTGQLPSEDPKQKLAEQSVPQQYSNIILKCLHSNHESRYPDAAQVKLAMEAFHSSTTRPSIPNVETTRNPTGHRLSTVVSPLRQQKSLFKPLLVAAGIIVAIIGLSLWSRARTNEHGTQFTELISDDVTAPVDISAPQSSSTVKPAHELSNMNNPVVESSKSEALQTSVNHLKNQRINGRVSAEKQRPGYEVPQETYTSTTVAGRAQEAEVDVRHFPQSSANNAYRQPAPVPSPERTAKAARTPQETMKLYSNRNVAASGRFSTDQYLRVVLQKYSAGDLHAVEATLREASATHPEEEGLKLMLGWLLVETNRPNDAIQLWQESLRSHPDHTSLMAALRYVQD